MTNDDKKPQHNGHDHHEMAGMDHSKMDHGDTAGMDHSKMDHGDMAGMDHSKMDHGDMAGMDHSKMDHGDMAGMDHSQTGHDMAGMDHSHMNHGGGGMGHMHHMGNFKQRFWVSLVAAIPVFVLSPFMGINLPFQFTFPGSDWVVLALSSFLFFWGGQPFFTGAWSELKDRRPAMMMLITMGIGVAYIYSVYAFIANHFMNMMLMDFFWELASLIVIMLLGHWVEMSATMKAGSALEQMAALLPKTAHVVAADGSVTDLPLTELTVGAQVQVQAGEQIPADGTVIGGNSAVNEALVTGEATAVTKTTGDTVIGGSVNGDGTLTVTVTGTGESGYLAQVAKLVSEAQAEQSKAETMADRVSRWLFYAALGVGLSAFIIWLTLADLDTALNRLVTVLVIACPHALGLAIPLVVARSTSIAATHGLLIRDRHALENVKQLDLVVMDKTGTLTEGDFKVHAIEATPGHDENTVLAQFAALEQSSSHPLATGILAAAKDRGVTIPEARDVTTVQGVGLTGTVANQDLAIVTASVLRERHLDFDEARFNALAEAGNTVSYLLAGDTVLGLIAQGDQLKENAVSFIQALKAQGIEPVMLTGDNAPAAKKVAQALGGITVQAELKPEDKERIVREYQAQGHHVMMVGDGINDAPSLARADIGVAIGAGTDVAIDAADVILVRSDPKDILNFLTLARNTTRKMVQNLWWGAGYNIIAIPLAAGVLAGIGFVLSPAVGAVVMSLSTIIVALNAMTLKM